MEQTPDQNAMLTYFGQDNVTYYNGLSKLGVAERAALGQLGLTADRTLKREYGTEQAHLRSPISPTTSEKQGLLMDAAEKALLANRNRTNTVSDMGQMLASTWKSNGDRGNCKSGPVGGLKRAIDDLSDRMEKLPAKLSQYNAFLYSVYTIILAILAAVLILHPGLKAFCVSETFYSGVKVVEAILLVGGFIVGKVPGLLIVLGAEALIDLVLDKFIPIGTALRWCVAIVVILLTFGCLFAAISDFGAFSGKKRRANFVIHEAWRTDAVALVSYINACKEQVAFVFDTMTPGSFTVPSHVAEECKTELLAYYDRALERAKETVEEYRKKNDT